MGTERFAGIRRLKRGTPALVAATLMVAVLAGGGSAVAAVRPGAARAPRTGLTAAGVITTVAGGDRKSTRLNSSHLGISYAVFCLKKKKDAGGRCRGRSCPSHGRPT